MSSGDFVCAAWRSIFLADACFLTRQKMTSGAAQSAIVCA
jgi:hypothetical protein